MTSTSAALPDDSARDLARLQGVWEQVRMEADGVVEPPDEHGGPGALTTIAGTQFSVRSLDGELLLEGSFVIDASTRPRSITWIDAIGEDQGKLLPASYVLDEDRFEFIAGEADAPRPIEFRTTPGQTMRTFVRHRQAPSTQPRSRLDDL
jgi:uncharacterized protein (TIGR03067 family)